MRAKRPVLGARRAIAEDHVVVVPDFVQAAAEDAFASRPRRQVEVEEGEGEVAWDEIEAKDIGGQRWGRCTP